MSWLRFGVSDTAPPIAPHPTFDPVVLGVLYREGGCEEKERLSGPLQPGSSRFSGTEARKEGSPALKPGRKITRGEAWTDRPENVEREVY